MDFLHGDVPNSVSRLELVLIGFAESCVEFEIFCLEVVGGNN